MKMPILIQSMFAVTLGALCSFASADETPAAPATQSAPSAAVQGTATPATPAAPIAPAWIVAHNYKYGELVNYDGWVFKAQSGSNRKRPSVAAEDGWEKLNPCDDKSKGAIQCAPAN
jgi:hypothetical protein